MKKCACFFKNNYHYIILLLTFAAILCVTLSADLFGDDYFYMKVKGGELSSMEQFRGILETLEERNVLQTVCTGNKKLVYASPFLYADL